MPKIWGGLYGMSIRWRQIIEEKEGKIKWVKKQNSKLFIAENRDLLDQRKAITDLMRDVVADSSEAENRESLQFAGIVRECGIRGRCWESYIRWYIHDWNYWGIGGKDIKHRILGALSFHAKNTYAELNSLLPGFINSLNSQVTNHYGGWDLRRRLRS